MPAAVAEAATAEGVVVSTEEVSAVALSTAVAFVVAVLVGGTGAATGAITDSLMMSSSAASAFLDGGAGAIRTDITVMTITRMITMAMDTAGTHTVTTVTAGTVTTVAPVMDIAMAAEPVTDTAMAADQDIPGVSRGGDRPGFGSLKSLAF